jgi:hypothetical protein
MTCPIFSEYAAVIQKTLAGIDLAKVQIASACQNFSATDQTVIIVTTIG